MRAHPALQEGYFNLDDLSFPSLLTIVTELAGLVHFTNGENQLKGDWRPFFRADETIVMSRILALDLAQATRQFDEWWHGTPEQVGFDTGQRSQANGWSVQALPVAALARDIDDWYRALGAASSESTLSLRLVIENVMVQLGKDAPEVLDALVHDDAPVLAAVWYRGAPGGGRESALGDAREPARLDKAGMRSAFHAFMRGVEMIRKEASARLPTSLLSQQHDPAIAMLIAFVQQFLKLQGKLNRFTGNYLDFYYDKLLGSVPLAAVPDHTWLVLRRNPAGRDVAVPAQTEFLAGVDADSRDIVYVSANDVLVTAARVGAVQTLFFEHDRHSAPESFLADSDQPSARPADGQRGWPTGAWFNVRPAQAEDGSLGAATPLLGAPKDSRQPVEHENARIGFCLASKVLLLKEGKRGITVDVLFADALLGARIDRLAAAMETPAGGAASPDPDPDPDPEREREREQILRKDIFLKVFRRLFRIAITGEHGWLPIPDYLPVYPWPQAAPAGQDAQEEPPALTLSFELPPEAPAVVAYRPALHGGDFDCTVPMLRLEINPGAYLYPFGLLRDLHIVGAHIAVEVSGCRDLVLHNNIGQLSAAAPFAPFGPLPRLGSYLVVGSTEMAGKRITAFGVDIEWADLPKIDGGFGAWYREYDMRVADSDFLATTTVLANGAWAPDSELDRPTVPLFLSESRPGRGARVASQVRWQCDRITPLFAPDAGVSPAHPLTYGPGAKNGFFKFTLAAPGFAFGHAQYPFVLSDTLVANVRTKRLRRQRAIPNAPYTPMINAISVHYKAQASIRIDRLGNQNGDGASEADQFIHLFPSGWERLGVDSYPAAALLPRFDYAGNLYIGLDGCVPGATLTLLFQLREDSRPPAPSSPPAAGGKKTSRKPPGLHWFYLTANTWKPLPPNRLVSDGTQHFMTSGIVTLMLPADIDATSTVMPGGRSWLRVSADIDIDRYCSLYRIDAQAVEVRRGPEVSPQVPVVLPAHSIARSRKPLPGITGVVQPLASTGGRTAETRAQLRMRVSERLRHKQRAISAADYEALILQAFPEVYKVKCFANLVAEKDLSRCIQPGHALVIPLPYWPAVRQAGQMPMLNGNLMENIRDFLQTLASPWSDISVQNPVYEQIQVRCSVKFAGALGNGYYINLLNDAISAFITPWQNGQGYSTHFGWRIRQHDLEAFIGQLPYVAHVSGFSMLRIASQDDLSFSLFDTAAPVNGQGAASAGATITDITPLCPWSIAIPVPRHAIKAVDDSDAHSPRRTALSRLEIGSTFIISDNHHDQQSDGTA